MDKKKRLLDKLTIISIAAAKEGLSYGKYMSKYNYDPPCLKNIPEDGITMEELRGTAENLATPEVYEQKPKMQCPECGEWFTPEWKRQVCCSKACQYERQRRQDRERYSAGKTQRYCEICGKPLPLSVSRRVFTCSKACSAERDRIRDMERNKMQRKAKGKGN